jgi:SAM-dependent methyltransferase
MRRNCPICGESGTRQLYQQTFSQMSEAVPIKGYDVVVCHACGFGYADNLPTQGQLDVYYKEMSKYENKHQAGKVSEAALANYQKIAESFGTFLPRTEARIADIGCATGGLLSAFQRNGYVNLQGIDPSPSCARTAMELYGIPVLICSLFDLEPLEKPFDVLVFSSVMEHLLDLAGALSRMRNLLAPAGLMFIEVPDTVNFAAWISAPFQQFSVEHVNFFSPMSLSNLMRRHSFEPVAIWHDLRTLGAITDPALDAVFRKTDQVEQAIVRDYETEVALERYIQLSEKDDMAVMQRINALVNSAQPVLVWGTGTQTQRLLATTALGKARIRAFVDSNPNYQGKLLNGVPILAPADLQEHPEPIVISSRVFQEEIATQINEVMRLKNEVIRLFDKPRG